MNPLRGTELGLVLMLVISTALGCSKKSSEPTGTVEPPLPSPTPVSAPQSKIDDQEITRAIKAVFSRDPGVHASPIDVSTTSGVVELTGRVGDILSKRRSTMLAEGVRGVRSVSNRIDLDVKKRPDAEIGKAVKDAMLYNPASDSFEVGVAVNDGVVTLTGTVQSWQEHNLAALLAEGIGGVREVKNEIRVAYPRSRPDSEVERDIESRYRWDRFLNDGLIQVAVKDGKVTLTGTVGSAAERRRADLSAWVNGVKDVDDSGLKVEWWAKEEDLRRNKFAKKSDAEVAQAIRDAVALDPRVEPAGLIATVVAGTATLTGHVRSAAAKMAAEQLARATVGVTDVKNELAVVPSKPVADGDVRQRVKDSLLYDSATDSYQIDVEVSGGTVTLKGNVDNAFERARAEQDAASINGVKRIENKLELKHPELPFVYRWYLEPYEPFVGFWRYSPPAPLASDAVIKQRIESELAWSPYVDAKQVNVTVVGGRVILSGRVQSPSERAAAVDDAFDGGAITVEDHLRLDAAGG